ncbi:MAG: CoA transferase [Acidimicrobiia bacterium]|nr:CoA transferase [Acidimicrobiia bacterium]
MGPLAGVKIIEIAGIGPGPFGAMMLSDLGAEVVRVDRAGSVRAEAPTGPSGDFLNRGRRSVGVDLKNPEGVEAVLRLVESADALIEGFRPGVAERLGIGPDACIGRNPALVYGRMTGWGQDGPYAGAAGHDINYVALSGTLHAIGRRGEAPLPPLNLVGDFGGGGMLLALGVVAALFEARSSGQGQVVDAAMVDGSALLATMVHAMYQGGGWFDERGVNLLDTGAHFYDVYETADGRYVSIGSLEPQFYAELLRLAGLDDDDELVSHQHDRERWPELKERVGAVFRSKTRDEWCELMEHSDVCFAPVLSLSEAPRHPHNVARGTFVEVAGMTQPGPAPRFSRTPASVDRPPAHPGEHTDEVLTSWGFAPGDIEVLRDRGAIA